MPKTARLLSRTPAATRSVRPVRRRHQPRPPERAVLADDAFFRHMVVGMRNGVIAITCDGRLAVINEEAYRILGVSPRTNDLGRPLADVLTDRPDVLRALTSAFDLHHLPNRAEMRLKPSNRVIGYTVTRVRDDRGTPVGAAMFFKDLTRVEQLEERERLRDRLAAVGQMAAAIAHEVKNPLAGIGVMAGLLRRRLHDAPEAQKVLTDIITEAKMANAIVQEVLDFVRPIRLQVEPIVLADVVQAAQQLADTTLAGGSVAVEVALPPGTPHLQADQHQLAQLFTNLFINACEAMDGRGRITVTAAPIRLEDGADGREALLVEVTDDGPGIAPDVLEKVFDPFFTTKPQGSGLGLSIVRKIVDAHDGRLDIHSAPGRGTTLRIALPLSVETGDGTGHRRTGSAAGPLDAVIREAHGFREEHERHGANSHR